MPYAAQHYPFERQGELDAFFPAQFIAEGLDQTLGWFYTLLVLGVSLFGKSPYRNVIVNGLILARDGKKMSKRLKNYPDPNDVMENYGADALRAYLIDSAVVRAEPMKFGKDASDTTGECVKETVRLVVLPLWNAYVFLATYAVADGWSPKPADLEVRPTGDLDRYILSRVERFVEELTLEYERYELSNLIPAFTRLCDDLNNWYIRRGRRRYWRAKNESAAANTDKQEAYATLLRVLTTLTRAMAPVMPFFTEYLHQRLMVDTGAPATYLDRSRAAALDLKWQELERSATTDAPRRRRTFTSVDLLRLPSLRVGPLTIWSTDSLVKVNEAIAGLGGDPFDGLLGTDVLGVGAAVIDYPTQRLYLLRTRKP